ncbi:XRE family transcriptional regulator [Listeria monocytogenes]|nr:XRE family transcriptional regulator [Listeria monocytogenes]EAE7365136.1 XRE family transcriptional regulator [Listeria monocytogenes]EAF6357782.1 XRE family transcriptional regulator [Listeria monocytogenes]EAG6224405.1 XRE family transcriptional regulator [Listeria monocytogenes]EDB9174009.1 helix-turn-helix transcriptional regulator [Listeria monocytogenes]
MDMYEKIKKLAEIEGYTIKELEKELEFPPNTLYKWRKQSPSIDRAEKVSSFFGISLDFLIGSPVNEAESLLEKALKRTNYATYNELLELIGAYYPDTLEISDKYIIIYDSQSNTPIYHLDKDTIFNASPEILSDVHEDVESAMEVACRESLEEVFKEYNVT